MWCRFGALAHGCLAALILVSLATCATVPPSEPQKRPVAAASADHTSRVSPDFRSRLLAVDAYRGGPPRSRSASVRYDAVRGLPFLVERLTEGIDDPFEKARVIHDWIALNIAYDEPAYRSSKIPAQDPVSVISSGKAVCHGYSNLYKALCELAGIPCQTIEGWADSGEKVDPFSPRNVGESNHAWNAVLLKGAWYLVDTTWDAGQVTGTTWKRDFVTSWFLAEPEVMIYRHLPEDPVWQLTSRVTTAREFAQFPFLESEYFEAFEKGAPELKRAYKVGGAVTLELPTPKADARVSYSLWPYPRKDENNTLMDCLSVRREGASTRVTVAFPKPGRYQLFIERAPDGPIPTGAFISRVVGVIGIEAADSGLLGVPRVHALLANEFSLLEPLEDPLLADTKHRFRLTLPESWVLRVRGDGVPPQVFAPVKGGACEFDLKTPHSGTLTLYAETPPSKELHYLARFGITTTGPARSRAETEITASRPAGPVAVDDCLTLSFACSRKLTLRCFLAETKSNERGLFTTQRQSDRVIVTPVDRGSQVEIWFPGAGKHNLRIEADADGYSRTFEYHVAVTRGTSWDGFLRMAAGRFLESDDAAGLSALIRSLESVVPTSPWPSIFDAPLRDGRTLLQLACANGKARIAALCLDSRVDPDWTDAKGMTPLMLAVQAQSEEIVRLLLSRGSHPRLKDFAGKSALDHAASGSSDAIRALLREATRR